MIAGGIVHESEFGFVRCAWRKVRTPQDSRLANGQAGRPDGIVQQRIDSPNAPRPNFKFERSVWDSRVAAWAMVKR